MTIQASKKQFADIFKTLRMASEKDLNVLLRGERGVGKTHMILEIAEERSLRLKYFSASTLDPFADLVGIPVPEGDHITYKRSLDINNAEFMFFDELNRAHKRVTNAVFEIIQFKALNGEVLKDLKVVWAAVNPWDADGYNTEELDAALLDRFHIHIDIPYALNFSFFEKKYGIDIGTIGYNWWEALSADLKAKISPRRMDYILEAIVNELPADQFVPLDVNVSLKQLINDISLTNLPFSFKELTTKPSKFIEILSSSNNSDQDFNNVLRILASLKPEQLVEISDITMALPADYFVKTMIRSKAYDNKFRELMLQKHGLSKLMELDKRVNEVLLK
jgi:hypothetical protein